MNVQVAGAGRVEQIAYVVPVLEAAIEQHSRDFGSGPYFMREARAECRYRGSPAVLGYRFALGQWGSVQIELVEPVGDAPSIFREITGVSPMVLHHVCLLPEDLPAQAAAFEGQGDRVVLDFTTPFGSRVVMLDTVERYGHFVELHERVRVVEQIYGNVREAARSFAGDRLIRPFEELFSSVPSPLGTSSPVGDPSHASEM
jgi:hypothetical protein